jgi:hypothetical protein
MHVQCNTMKDIQLQTIRQISIMSTEGDWIDAEFSVRAWASFLCAAREKLECSARVNKAQRATVHAESCH